MCKKISQEGYFPASDIRPFSRVHRVTLVISIAWTRHVLLDPSLRRTLALHSCRIHAKTWCLSNGGVEMARTFEKGISFSRWNELLYSKRLTDSVLCYTNKISRLHFKTRRLRSIKSPQRITNLKIREVKSI